MNSTALHTPIGWLKISEEDGMVTEITHSGYSADFNGTSTPLLEEVKKQLCEYFDGTRYSFDLPLKIEGSEFNKRVLCELSKVPYGQTVTYGELAKRCGSPNAARAVGSAMRKNPFVIVLPCHRVLPQSGKLGNYSAGGPANKDWLLTFEKQNSTQSLLGNPLFAAFWGL